MQIALAATGAHPSPIPVPGVGTFPVARCTTKLRWKWGCTVKQETNFIARHGQAGVVGSSAREKPNFSRRRHGRGRERVAGAMTRTGKGWDSESSGKSQAEAALGWADGWMVGWVKTGEDW